MNSSQVGIFEQRHQVRLSRLLQSHNGARLETEIGLEVLRDFTDKTLEGELADEEVGALLVLSDLTKGDCAGLETMGLLDTTSGSH